MQVLPVVFPVSFVAQGNVTPCRSGGRSRASAGARAPLRCLFGLLPPRTVFPSECFSSVLDFWRLQTIDLGKDVEFCLFQMFLHEQIQVVVFWARTLQSWCGVAMDFQVFLPRGLQFSRYRWCCFWSLGKNGIGQLSAKKFLVFLFVINMYPVRSSFVSIWISYFSPNFHPLVLLFVGVSCQNQLFPW